MSDEGKKELIEWEDVNLTTKEIGIRNKKGFTTKGKRARIIPISQTVNEILINQKNNNSNSEIVNPLG